jgi:hypothetical protein
MFLPRAVMGKKYCDAHQKRQARLEILGQQHVVERIITVCIVRNIKSTEIECVLLLHLVLQS